MFLLPYMVIETHVLKLYGVKKNSKNSILARYLRRGGGGERQIKNVNRRIPEPRSLLKNNVF
jgi:hypothetical protein